MALLIAAGHSVTTALAAALPSCPGEILGAVAGAEQAGTLPTVLRSQASTLARRRDMRSSAAVFAYVLLMITAIPAIVCFYFALTVPKLEAVLEDFETELSPWAMHATTIVSYAANPWIALIAPLVVALIYLQTRYMRHFVPRDPRGGQTPYAIWDALMWATPWTRRSVSSSALAAQLPAARASIRAGHDLPAALRHAADAGANVFARRRLLRWADAIESGETPAKAAARVGMPRPVLLMTSNAVGDAALADGLAYLSAYYRGVCEHWRRVFLSFVWPTAVLVSAIMTCALACSAIGAAPGMG